MTDGMDKLDEFVLGDPNARYSSAYVEHALRPKNVGNCDSANAYGTQLAHDGNAMEIWLRVDGDVIMDSSFWTEGCGTTIACGSVLTEMVKNKDIWQAFEIMPEDIDKALGGLPDDSCVCARLTIETLKAALRDYLAYKNEPWRRMYAKR